MEFEFKEGTLQENTVRLKKALLKIAHNRKIQQKYPDIQRSADLLKQHFGSADEDVEEIAFLNLYCDVHRVGSTYSGTERHTLDDKHGYFNHPGGISPLLKGGQFITPDTVLVDLGAGNGLQGLFFQLLYPHQRTIQVELSAEMIQAGKEIQSALEIPDDKILWQNQDIMDFDFNLVDFIYLYRPSKPIKSGTRLYKNIADKLREFDRPLIIYSIADCLKDYIDDRYKIFYTDGHLTCFQSSHPFSSNYESDHH